MGEVEAADEHAAIEKAAEQFKVPATKADGYASAVIASTRVLRRS
jgi:hypothetical protein